MSESGEFAATTHTVMAHGDSRSSPALAAVRPTSVCVNGSMPRQLYAREWNEGRIRVRAPPAEVAVIAYAGLDQSSEVVESLRGMRLIRESACRLCLSRCA